MRTMLESTRSQNGSHRVELACYAEKVQRWSMALARNE